VCQDVALWMRQGLMDAIYPMMYFKDANFYPIAIDWQERSAGKDVAPGLGIYMMHPRERNWALSDITRELWVLSQYGMGNCMFRSKFFSDNTKGIYDFYSKAFAKYPAIPSSNNNHLYHLYHLYGSDTYPVDVTKAENLLAINLSSPYIEHDMTENIRYFAVTSADGNKVIREYGDDSSLTHDNNGKNNENLKLSDGTLVIITTVLGNDYTSVIAKNGTFDTSRLPAGHYKAYIMNRKGHRHLVRRFSIEP
ncbi:MAG: hypothetical protein J6S52_02420, partial [Prevotella sp.]|nr:hypothetical protein [Prevotella sp.]